MIKSILKDRAEEITSGVILLIYNPGKLLAVILNIEWVTMTAKGILSVGFALLGAGLVAYLKTAFPNGMQKFVDWTRKSKFNFKKYKK